MRIITFGCSHFASADVQMILQDRTYDYKHCANLATVIKRERPDLVIDLGDWEEDYYEPTGMAIRLCPELAQIERVRIKGNHDRAGLLSCTYDGVLYEHGYKKIYNTGDKVVHAHTHNPHDGWPLDVGSITFTGTYGIVVNGLARLEYL